MQPLDALKSILAEVGPAGIWRPVYDGDGNCLAAGIGEPADGLPEAQVGELFKGKTVIDLGCNFGFYSFLARRAGACRVLGVDSDSRVIQGCRILSQLFALDGVSFTCADIKSYRTFGKFDLGLMVDFIGKDVIKTGGLPLCLAALQACCGNEILLTLRRRYPIGKKLGGAAATLAGLYGEDYIRQGHFHLLDYIQDQLLPRWSLSLLNPRAGGGQGKETLHAVRRPVFRPPSTGSLPTPRRKA